jgi:error-prone DNA polymerase
LEPASTGPDGLALRLGLRQVKGLGAAEARALVAARGNGYADPRALWRRAGLGTKALEALARADAFRSLGLDRRAALWAVKGLPAGTKSAAPLPLFAAARTEDLGAEPAVQLPELRLSEHVVDDYASLRFSLKAHPVSFLRPGLAAEGMVEAARLPELPKDKPVKVAGLVLVRQRPGTAKGVIFATLEDETGVVNVIVWPDVFARQRKVLLGARLLGVEGPLQREGLVIHVIAKRLVDLSPRLEQLSAPQGDSGFDRAAREAGAPALYPSRNFR